MPYVPSNSSVVLPLRWNNLIDGHDSRKHESYALLYNLETCSTWNVHAPLCSMLHGYIIQYGSCLVLVRYEGM